MGFWIFMLVCNLLLPIMMICFGKYFTKTAPKEINSLFGYRTTMSMKNIETWQFAHHCCGKLWVKIGFILLFITIIINLMTLNFNKNQIGMTAAFICLIQLFGMIGSIVVVEKALKKVFDSDGNKKK